VNQFLFLLLSCEPILISIVRTISCMAVTNNLLVLRLCACAETICEIISLCQIISLCHIISLCIY